MVVIAINRQAVGADGIVAAVVALILSTNIIVHSFDEAVASGDLDFVRYVQFSGTSRQLEWYKVNFILLPPRRSR